MTNYDEYIQRRWQSYAWHIKLYVHIMTLVRTRAIKLRLWMRDIL